MGPERTGRHLGLSQTSARATEAMTLVEVLVTITVLGIALGALMGALLSNTALNTDMARRAEAIRISERTMEGYRQASNYGTLRGATTASVAGTRGTYTVNTTFCPATAPSSMPCSGTAVYIRVEVTNGNKVLQRAETYYTSFGSE